MRNSLISKCPLFDMANAWFQWRPRRKIYYTSFVIHRWAYPSGLHVHLRTCGLRLLHSVFKYTLIYGCSHAYRIIIRSAWNQNNFGWSVQTAKDYCTSKSPSTAECAFNCHCGQVRCRSITKLTLTKLDYKPFRFPLIGLGRILARYFSFQSWLTNRNPSCLVKGNLIAWAASGCVFSSAFN